MSFRFTGEDPEHLEDMLGNISTRLKDSGHKVFCSYFMEDYFQKKKMGTEEIYTFCLDKIDEYDTFLAIVTSQNRSQGMDIESDKAFELKKNYILLIQPDLSFDHFKQKANHVIVYQNLLDMYRTIGRLASTW